MIRRCLINQGCFLCLACWLAIEIPAARADQSEKYELKESASPARIESVAIHVDVAGSAEFAIEKGKTLVHPLSARATLKYRERRLPGAGRDAEAYRSLRHYDAVETEIKVADHVTTGRLASDRPLIVAQGRREGILYYCLDGPLSAAELEYIHAPGDSLALAALLPGKPVAIGEKWTAPSWVGQMFTDTEAASKSELEGTLASVEGGVAKVIFTGTVEGATAASTGKIEIHGFFLFDQKAQRLTRAETEQSEVRTVGPIAPGMKVTAKSVLIRTPSDDANGLSEEAAASVPLDPPAALTELRFRAPWNVEFSHDRAWHVFQQSAQIAVLRLIDQGVFVAQCNLAPVRRANAGEHVPEQQFQDDIRASLGPRLKSIEKAETVPLDGERGGGAGAGGGRFLYRVVAVGEANHVAMTWTYYLCAAPDGAQTSFVFAVETALRDRLAGRDLSMLKSLRFVEPPKESSRKPPGTGSTQ